MELDLDLSIPMDEDIFPLGSVTCSDTTDVVKWQCSQTSCVALDNLIMEASRPVPRRSPRHIKPLLQWHSPDSSISTYSSPGSSALPSATSTSSLTSSLPTKRRARPRPLRHGHPDPSASMPQPTSSRPKPTLFKKDPSEFLNLLKGVSERVDEHANAKRKSIMADGDVREAKRTKRPALVTRDGVLAKRGRGVKENRGVPAGATLAAVTGVTEKGKGKEKETATSLHRTDTSEIPFSVRNSPTPPHASVSTLPRPSSSVSRRSIDADPNYDMSVDADEKPVSRTITRSSDPTTRRSQMPPPAAPKDVSTSPSVVPKSSMSTPPNTTANPKFHPLIQQRTDHKSRPPEPQHQPQRSQSARPPHILPPSENLRPASLNGPSQSQSNSRPPLLGMRRARTLPLNSFTPSQSLPGRQKAFKVPFRSQSQSQFSQQPKPQPRPSPQPTPQTQAQRLSMTQSLGSKPRESTLPPPMPTPTPTPTPPLPPPQQCHVHTNRELMQVDEEQQHPPGSPDSSFGDLSFDMDALEETMRKYD